MTKLKGMFEFIKAWEGEDVIITAKHDVDLKAYAQEYGYCDPVFFKAHDGYFIFDIYETTPGKYCIDDCTERFEDTK